MKRKKEIENTLFSFLDVISCGFGAIVMLVLIYKFNPSNKIENFEDENEVYLMELNKLQLINKELKKHFSSFIGPCSTMIKHHRN